MAKERHQTFFLHVGDNGVGLNVNPSCQITVITVTVSCQWKPCDEDIKSSFEE